MGYAALGLRNDPEVRLPFSSYFGSMNSNDSADAKIARNADHTGMWTITCHLARITPTEHRVGDTKKNKADVAQCRTNRLDWLHGENLH